MAILAEISLGDKNFKKYKTLTPEIYKKALKIAKRLRGRRIFHINSAAQGGGVAELLRSQVALERDLGLDSRWFVLKAGKKFFKTTKKIHNLLQGGNGRFLTRDGQKTYFNEIKTAARQFNKLISRQKPDIVLIHDPQPLPLIKILPDKTASIFRIHIDLSKPNKKALELIRPMVEKFTQVALTSRRYRPRWLGRKKAVFIMPAIDPFLEKNKKIPAYRAEDVLALFAINIDKPIISQVSRFDLWKDPLGVIRAYYLAKNEIPDLQLVLAGIMEASDDPEAKKLFKKVRKHAECDPDIFLFSKRSDLEGVPHSLFINALQTASGAVLQKSIREGFGLTVTEAMWKKKAVVGGKAEGIKLQIKNGKNGFIASGAEDMAEKIARLIKNPALAHRIGGAARKTVKEKFLMSRLVFDHLKLYETLI